MTSDGIAYIHICVRVCVKLAIVHVYHSCQINTKKLKALENLKWACS